ncbi:ATP-dependent endonuclease [Erwinia sp. OLTSP20]|uniref:ATP-dependent nuclease n=1 Tax=unclassified Erwinia TaxID=2622719 RepID=UPI000C1857CE|nr:MULTISPECIES: ATP-dependent endonuclease [unclassified Erwinia]PIJ51295.1 ATP-dependent endonuclease [Erwinia sp. OAMSP11]PIJ74080.1 ATP-dependent endonuclease [Erwinia sp. OLSSP12]PIJ81186.1 ATP-dependent endonuclease [Erwinia sp. OLCASP19]PIJ86043.1 ATP-dependent endonuclease [Erwinia sp. OLMTSP26]PIJ87792.1 ATP-dependent endonuclease [Erwinia sp. OLMDSP33]
MILEHIEIMGFRGINRLSLALEDNNVLIGENAWGKTSLLDALSLAFAPHRTQPVFRKQDFFQPPGEKAWRQLHIQFYFKEARPGDAFTHRYQPLRPVLYCHDDDRCHRLCYQLAAQRDSQGNIHSSQAFINPQGQVLAAGATAQSIALLRRLHPVLRLRDARIARQNNGVSGLPLREAGQLADELNLLMSHWHDARPLPQESLRQGVKTLQQLMEHYFAVQPADSGLEHHPLPPDARASRQSWRHLDTINHMLADSDRRSRRTLLRMFALLLQARGGEVLDPLARPLLILEEPETRLHPIMLSVASGMLELLPLQKIITTNSSELLSQTPVEQLCRLVRNSRCIKAWRIGTQGMNAEESRRIAFHIRFNRPSALFARCWLLVEGETEVWIINELARQSGFHFAAEGIRVIEYAQAGLRPLLRFAQRMGIGWHVLTDGDAAGQKYAASARSLAGDVPADMLARYVTQLPALDMEHFLYKSGFSEVYHRIARLPPGVATGMHRAITKAIHQASKPGLAIAVALDAAERGRGAIPVLLQQMFTQVLQQAQLNSDEKDL